MVQAGHHAGLNKVAANSVIADALGELDLNVDPQEMKAAAKKAKKLRHKANKRQRSSDASQVA